MSNSISVSFEFFPPKTQEGVGKLLGHVHELSQFRPDFFSVTYGAGGSTQDGSFSLIAKLKNLGLEAAPHLSCIGASEDGLLEVLTMLKSQNVKRIVALRGDLPSGMGSIGQMQYASDLVAFIRKHTGDWFHIEVAAYPEYHPQSKSPDADFENFITKVRAGASSAITQYFYNPDSYAFFLDRVRSAGVDIPIVPGVMPITNHVQLARFSESCGAEIPRWILMKLASYGDDKESIRAFGQEVVIKLCDRLIELGAPSLHFYTLNQSAACINIIKALR